VITASSSSNKGWTDAGNDVFYATDAITTVGPEEIAFLKSRAGANRNRRSRICLHRTPEERLHSMLIVQQGGGYLRPHLHVGKCESFHVIEGAVSVVIFDDDGEITSALELGTREDGRTFFYRMPAGVWHGFLVRTDWLVFHEASEGPFDASRTLFPQWAPDGADAEESRRFLATLEERLRAFAT
jgi:cupin fold WbuC family metalloprotein